MNIFKMLIYFVATYCIVSASGFSVLDQDYLVVQSDEEGLYWPESYTVKATRIYIHSSIVEDYTVWKTNQSSRVDFNQGTVKVITKLYEDEKEKEYGEKYEIRPETTEETLNEIVCHLSPESWDEDLKLDDILPTISEEVPYEAVSNETIDEIETVKFESIEVTPTKEVRHTVWAYYDNIIEWVPVKYEVHKYNKALGSLLEHEIWTFFDFYPRVDNEEVFDEVEFGCDADAVKKHTSESDRITKELYFVDPDNEKHVEHVFTHFKNKFDRKYAHEQEYAMRKIIFNENLRLISLVNRANLAYKLAVNQFSDWTPEELERSRGAIPRPEGLKATVAFPYDESTVGDIVSQLPKQYDMRLLGLISPVKNQGHCGSCWTFAAAAVTESGFARINGGRVMALSSQAIVDCAYEDLGNSGAGGCSGGFDFAAYEFIQKHGLPTDEEYGPYKAKESFCNIGNMTKTYAIAGYAQVTPYNFNSMKVAVMQNGPLFIYVHVSKQFHLYSNGIFYQSNAECKPDRPNHAVALVGYGERNGELFWILKNSWGTEWGMEGYMLVAAKDNVCGVASNPTYPVFY